MTDILLFPGVMATRLKFPNANRIWDPDDNLNMAGWALNHQKNRRDMHFAQPAGFCLEPRIPFDPLDKDTPVAKKARGWGEPSWRYYGKCLKELQDLAMVQGGNAYAIGYDWRQDIKWLGRRAARKINLYTSNGNKPIIVTHSMGGLVVRSALKDDPTLQKSIAGVIHICQPSVGSVLLYRRLLTGLIPGLDGTKFNWLKPWKKAWIEGKIFRTILGTKRKNFLET